MEETKASETKAPKVKIEATAELPEEEPRDEVLADAQVEEGVEEKAASEQVAGEAEEAGAAVAVDEGGADDVPADAAPDAASEPESAPEPAEAPAAPAPVASVPAATRGFSAWLTLNFPGYEHTALGAFTGLVLALLVFAIGVWRVVFIAAMITGGAVIGSFFDGESGIRRAIRRMLGGNKG